MRRIDDANTSKNQPVFNPRTFGFQPCAKRRAREASNREGHHHATRVLAEDFRRKSDLPKAVESYEAVSDQHVFAAGLV